MTESSWPFDANDTTEAQYSYLLRLIADSGVIGTPGSSDLKAYADSSGLFVKVPAGAAVVRGFYYMSDSLVTLSISAASSTARIDSIVLRLDPQANTIRLAVKTGTTAAPGLSVTDTGIYELRIANVTVAANATTIPGTAVTDARNFTSQEFGSWTTGTRPPGSREGKAGYNYSTKTPEYFDGSTWRPFTVPTTDASLLTSGMLPTARLDYGVVMAARADGRSFQAPMTDDVIDGDWNLVLQPGVYRTDQNKANRNAPDGSYGFGTLMVIGAGASISSRTQVYYAATGGMYWRSAWNGTDWGVWRNVTYASDIVALIARVATEEQARAAADATLGGRIAALEAKAALAPKTGHITIDAGQFFKDSVTGRYLASVPVSIYPAFPGTPTVKLFGIANSNDAGSVTVQQDPDHATTRTGGYLNVSRRNGGFDTGIDWVAVAT